MLSIGDVHVYVTDFQVALRFWVDGLGLRVIEQEIGASTAFAVLVFPAGGVNLRLFGGAEPWPDGGRPAAGSRPTIRFDLETDDFDTLLLRVLEHGGRQIDEIEMYENLRVVTVADPDENTFELVEVPPLGSNGNGAPRGA